MTKQYKARVYVFICRAQGYHNGHKTVTNQALNEADLTIVCLGSANRSRDMYNPFTAEEREQMFLRDYDTVKGAHLAKRLQFVHLDDFLYDDPAWEQDVQKKIRDKVYDNYGPDGADIKLIGLEKDGSSYYLKKFPQWGSVAVKPTPECYMVNDQLISATLVRELYFDKGIIPSQLLPLGTTEFLSEFMNRHPYSLLVEEHEFNERHKAPYKGLKWGHIDQTVDAVVIQSGHVLMIERGHMPGIGLWALPGGYLEEYEDLYTAAIRELTEEVGISFTEKPKPDITKRILHGSFVTSQRFADPYRSMRGRIITEAHLFRLEEREHLPWIKPNKPEAMKAVWIPLAELDPRRCFEDHYFIVQKMKGLTR